jgi:aminotransferase
MPASPIRRLAPFAVEARKKGKTIYSLNIGQPDIPTPQQVLNRLRAYGERNVPYGPSQGLPEFIETLRAYYGRVGLTLSAEEIFVTTGGSEAILFVLGALADSGDEVIVFEPFYENYGPDGILSGATPRYVTLRPPDWTYRPEELAAAFNERTKAIVINTPNNPTGKVFTREELAEIAGLCRKWDTFAVTDEIYEHILYDGAEHVSLATLPGMAERTVTINSISKTYSVTGWRVGWAIADARVTQRIRKVHDFLTVGAPTPFQHAAVVALGLPDEYYVGLRDHYTEARTFLLQTLETAGFHCSRPRGAYYVIADTTRLAPRLGAADDVQFSRRLIEETGVATVPGSSFYSDPARGRDQVRFCFCKRWETLHAVRERFERWRTGRPGDPE